MSDRLWQILRHGRLYVGAQHLAFICTIIGLKCNVVIAYTDIVSMSVVIRSPNRLQSLIAVADCRHHSEKTVTARVIPNAISIKTQQGDQVCVSDCDLPSALIRIAFS